MRIALAALTAMLPLSAQATALCDAVALEYRAEAFRTPGIVPSLDDLPKVAVKGPDLEPIEPSNEAEARAILKRRFNLGADLTGDLDWFSRLSVTKLGRTEVVALWDIQGTAHCSSYFFLLVSEGAPARRIEEPRSPEVQDLCWTESGWLGEIAGHPAFAVQSRAITTPSYRATISPWHGDRWGEACAVEAQFEALYRLDEADYRASAWPALAAIAPQIASDRSLDDDAPTYRFGLPGDEAKYQAMLALTDQASGPMPRFGTQPRGYDWFDPDSSAYFPLVVDGETYLARIGHGSLGWRVSGDYLLGVWDLQDGKLTPLAGAIIALEVGKLRALKVSRSLDVTPAE